MGRSLRLMRLVGWGRKGDIVNDVDTRGIACCMATLLEKKVNDMHGKNLYGFRSVFT